MLDIKPRKGLENIEDYQVETIPNAKIVVNANECNENITPELTSRLQKLVTEFSFNRYPSMGGEELRAMVAKDMQVALEQVVVGNGSSELLQMACFAFGGNGRTIAVPYPSFSMYEEYVQLADSKVVRYPLTLEGYVDAEHVIAFYKQYKPALLIICNPNNPTGNFNPLSTIETILSRVKCPVVVDEAYMEFAEGRFGVNEHSVLQLLDKYSNFICLKTFSKAYGLAGLRVGYGVGSKQVARIMQKVLLPYHVNGFSLAVAAEAYAQRDALNARLATIIKEREGMREAFTSLGFKVFPSGTNFLLLQPEGELTKLLARRCAQAGLARQGDEQILAGMYVFDQLLKKSILVRNFSKHPALTGALRITVGREEENAQLWLALKNIVEGVG